MLSENNASIETPNNSAIAGKSAMSGFIAQLKSKAASAGLKVTEVNPYKLKLSQYDPYTDTYRKKDLSERWQEMKAGSEQYIQRDVL